MKISFDIPDSMYRAIAAKLKGEQLSTLIASYVRALAAPDGTHAGAMTGTEFEAIGRYATFNIPDAVIAEKLGIPLLRVTRARQAQGIQPGTFRSLKVQPTAGPSSLKEKK